MNITQYSKKLTLGFFLAASLHGCTGITPATPSDQTNWATLDSRNASLNAPQVKVETNAQSYQVGDPIRFRVSSNKSGRLWVVSVNSHNEATILLPNEAMQDNVISAGESFDIPNKMGGQELRAASPTGQSLVAFIVTPANKTLDDILVLRNEKLAWVGFASDQTWGMTKIKIHVVK